MLFVRNLTAAAGLATTLLASPAAAQDRVVPSSPEQLRLSFAPVARKAAPSVVNVYAAKTVVARSNPLFEDPLFRRFSAGRGPGGPQVQRSLGSGVIVDAGGLVVTNNHVIEGASEIKVSLADKREFEAQIVLKTRVRSRCVAASGCEGALSGHRDRAIPMRCRSATWCSRSAIRSASARP